MKKTNKYVRYIKCFSIMIVTLLLSFTLVSQNVYAYEAPDSSFISGDWVDTVSGTEMIGGYSYTWVTFDTNMIDSETITFYSLNELVDISSHQSDFPAIEYVSTDNGLNRISINSTTLGDLNTYHGYTRDFRVYLNNSLLTLDPTEVAGVFLSKYFKQFRGNITQFMNIINTDIQEAYDSGYIDGRNDFAYYSPTTQTYYTGLQAIELGKDISKEIYGWEVSPNNWITASAWGTTRYNDGLNASQQEAYDQGFINGSEDSFMASIKDWIVPAIIVVLFLGGAVSIIVKKREA